MRVLVVGNPSSIYLKSHFREVLLQRTPAEGESDRFSIVNSHGVRMDPASSAFYRGIGVPVLNRFAGVAGLRGRIGGRLAMLVAAIALWWDVSRFGPYDVVHIHYLTTYLAPSFLRGRILGQRLMDRLVITIWGSDLYRDYAHATTKRKALIARADILSVSTGAMEEALIGRYGEGCKPRIRYARFGLPLLAEIARIQEQESPSRCRQVLGLPVDRILVACGYGASRAQQHGSVLEALAACPASIRDRTHVVLSMTYPSDPGYIAEMSRLAAARGLSYSVFDSFLEADDVARMRISCDLFVNSLTTDGFSGSMNEFLAAGALVLHGGWLSYPDLVSAGVYRRTFADPDDLTAQLTVVLADMAAEKEKCRGNPQRIRDLCSWDSVRSQWFGLYDKTSAHSRGGT